jgi:hypothetical protein
MGTFGGTLEARRIDASNGRLTADVKGEVETEEGVLIIRRIHVAMRLEAPEESRAMIQRVHDSVRDEVPVVSNVPPCDSIEFVRRDCKPKLT